MKYRLIRNRDGSYQLSFDNLTHAEAATLLLTQLLGEHEHEARHKSGTACHRDHGGDAGQHRGGGSDKAGNA